MEDIFIKVEKTRKTIIGKNGKNEYRYYLKLKCRTCGFEKESHATERDSLKKSCKNCEKNKNRKSFIDYENKIYKVLDYSHTSKDGKRIFFKIKCKLCGHEHVCRKDQIKEVKSFCAFCRTNTKTPTLKAPSNVYYCQYRYGAKSRGLNFELTIDEFEKIIHKNCYFCNAKPIPIRSLKTYNRCKHDIYVNGIDRLNPEKGYVISNIVACCQMCNRMKMKMNEPSFLNKIKEIYEHSIKGSTTIPKGSTL
jgi:hypothetical protein